MPTKPATCRLASVTYTLPGPTMRSTAGMDSVPNARAATAWAPPTFATVVAPARAAAYSTAGWIEPSCDGGVQTTMPSTPATTAGTTVMATEDGYSARPARHVAARPGDRAHDLAEPNAVALVPPLRRELAAVEIGEALDQGIQGRLQLCRNGLLGLTELLGRDGEAGLAQVRAVELQCDVEQGVVALERGRAR